MNELYLRDFLLYIAGALGVFGTAALNTDFWYGIIAIGLSVVIFVLRIFLKTKQYITEEEE